MRITDYEYGYITKLTDSTSVGYIGSCDMAKVYVIYDTWASRNSTSYSHIGKSHEVWLTPRSNSSAAIIIPVVSRENSDSGYDDGITEMRIGLIFTINNSSVKCSVASIDGDISTYPHVSGKVKIVLTEYSV